MQLKIYEQSWQEVRKPTLRWMIALAGVTWIVILVHPLFSALASKTWPEWLQGFFPPESLVDLGGWAKLVVMGWVLPLLIAIYAAGLGSWLIAGEEERGSLGMLLASPLRRYRLVLEKAAVLVVALSLLTAAAWMAFLVAAWIGKIAMRAGDLARGGAALLLFGAAVGGLALAFGGLTGRRRLSRWITILAVLVMLVAGHLPDALPIQGVHWLSPFYHYLAALRGDTTGLALLIVLVLAVLLLTWLGFERRDLPV